MGGLVSLLMADKLEKDRRAQAQSQLQGLLGQFGQEPAIPQGGISPEGYVGNQNYSPQTGERQQAELLGGLLGAGYTTTEAGGIFGAQVPVKSPTTQQQNFSAYQGMGATDRTLYEQFRQSGAANTTINMNGGQVGVPLTTEQKDDMGFSPQSVVVPDKQGIPRVVNKEKFTQPQILSGGFAARMSQATNQLNSVMAAGGFDPASVQQNADLFGVPGVFANYMKTPEGQQYRQAQTNWISANLRKESGAAIPVQEMEEERKKWFPEPGDQEEVIAQKRAARVTAEAAMRKGSAGFFEEMQRDIKASKEKAANPPPLPPGFVPVP